MISLVIYDIPSDNLRSKAADICQDLRKGLRERGKEERVEEIYYLFPMGDSITTEMGVE